MGTDVGAVAHGLSGALAQEPHLCLHHREQGTVPQYVAVHFCMFVLILSYLGANTCLPQVPAAVKCQCRKDIKCYLTLKDCRDQAHALTPHVTDSNVDCENLVPERPFYACWEEPHICRGMPSFVLLFVCLILSLALASPLSS